ncbi:hypothetical protein ACS127_08515 [Amphibacillus sp. Q70]|uniref:hypothetical protein n=1 Tax=Amphibacillus sp. Q70 TaxID=3453416 RepID=UPI003F85DA5E
MTDRALLSLITIKTQGEMMDRVLLFRFSNMGENVVAQFTLLCNNPLFLSQITVGKIPLIKVLFYRSVTGWLTKNTS